MIRIIGNPDLWGIIPSFLSEEDPRSAKEQINANYIGGWNSFEGFKYNADTGTLKYPGDPEMQPLAVMIFREEILTIYESSWVVITQGDGSWEVARLD